MVHGRSLAEDIVCSWLKEHMVITSERGIIKAPSGHWMELDIYLPEISFAIECDGSRYHKESDMSYNRWQLINRGADMDMKKNLPLWKGYHKWKDDQCSKKGIKLIHVISEDVIDFPEQTKKYIFDEIQSWCSLCEGKK